MTIIGLMFSLDITALYTNFPLEKTIQICLDLLYTLPHPPNLPRAVSKKLLEFATERATLFSVSSTTTKVWPWAGHWSRQS